MRVELRGIHSVRKRLTTGVVTYYYAWRGGPRLQGEPGSPEFLASYQAAHAGRRKPNPALFQSIIAGYRASSDFARLGERTKVGYRAKLRQIEDAFGTMPLDVLEDPGVTRDFLDWRDGMAGAPRQADYAWTILMRVISWGRDRGLTTYRPPDRVERLHHSDRSERIWEPDQIAAFMAVASTPLQHALVLALETGQRQGDLLALPWSAYDGTWIRLRQAKAKRHGRPGRLVSIPVTRTLRAVLEALPRTSPVILANGRGRPWGSNAFRKAWAAAARKAGIVDLHFHDLRGTAVSRLAEAGCTVSEIAAITGHSLRDAAAIIDRYLSRTDKLAIAAIAKLERGGS